MFKMGVIGFGGMGNFHTKLVREKISRMEVKGAYDIKPEKKVKVEEAGLLWYDTAEALINDPEIDLVLITTPNNFHKPYAIQALRAGKHVLCEKPVMMNSEELEEVLAVAKEEGKIFTVHQNRRWDRDYLIVKDVYEKGTIGKPFYIESKVVGARGIPGDWRCTKVAGGGMMLDWGVHLIDQLLMLIDSPVVEVYAQVLNVKYQEIDDVDDNFKMMMKFENGTNALVEVGTFHLIDQPRWYINGDAGTLKIADWGSGADIVRALDVEMDWENAVVFTAAGPTRTMAARPKDSTESMHIDIAEKRTNYMLHEMLCDGMETGDYSKVAVQPNELRRSMKIMEAAFKSSKEGIVVKERI